ncbi:hypothetical protein MOQ72_25285 [Saccharopolyspora sp. K220]|uniref:hypothetical protein n=1 Tax=Saccharopolyspora soli TaxID=2926618 RepID=UPI001F58D9E1|nr:hypothetical protein [Saccharopolyspora soli]MCI2420766.1 hypothetical protein [Saccharopolyspora soli]
MTKKPQFRAVGVRWMILARESRVVKCEHHVHVRLDLRKRPFTRIWRIAAMWPKAQFSSGLAIFSAEFNCEPDVYS